MKILKIIFAASVLMLFYACDILDELDEQTEVDVTTTYTGVMNIGVPEVFGIPDESSRVQESGGIDLIANPDVADVIGSPEQIKNVEIKRITYEYRNFNGNVDTDLIDGFLQFTISPIGAYSIGDVNVAESDLLGTVYTLSGDFSPVNEQVNKTKVFVYVLQSTATHNPATFQVVINVTMKLRVKLDGL